MKTVEMEFIPELKLDMAAASSAANNKPAIPDGSCVAINSGRMESALVTTQDCASCIGRLDWWNLKKNSETPHNISSPTRPTLKIEKVQTDLLAAWTDEVVR